MEKNKAKRKVSPTKASIASKAIASISIHSQFSLNCFVCFEPIAFNTKCHLKHERSAAFHIDWMEIGQSERDEKIKRGNNKNNERKTVQYLHSIFVSCLFPFVRFMTGFSGWSACIKSWTHFRFISMVIDKSLSRASSSFFIEIVCDCGVWNALSTFADFE